MAERSGSGPSASAAWSTSGNRIDSPTEFRKGTGRASLNEPPPACPTVGTYDKDAGPNDQRLYLNGARVAQMSDTLPIDLNSAALGIGRHVSGIADPFNGHIDEFRTAHVQRSGGWIATTWNNMSNPGAFAVAGADEQERGEAPPLAGAGVVVCLMG